MSTDLHEAVPPMPPLSMAIIEQVGVRMLEEFAPEMLQAAGPLDIVTLIDRTLPGYGVHFYPASAIELEDRMAATDPSGDRETIVLLRHDLYEELYEGGRAAHRARATVAHELAHVVLHVPVIRRRLKSPLGAHLLNRVERRQLRAFEDPEWQAWALGGSLLMPRATVTKVQPFSVTEIGARYGVSEGMARSHLKRLRLLEGGQ
jgi:hypothetical protein